MRSARVYRNSKLAGILKQEDDRTFSFKYDPHYLSDELNQSVSLTIPRSNQKYKSDYLFPFFFNMLTEGVNRKVQCRHLQISEEDHFGLLLATSSKDSVGAISVKEIIEK